MSSIGWSLSNFQHEGDEAPRFDLPARHGALLGFSVAYWTINRLISIGWHRSILYILSYNLEHQVSLWVVHRKNVALYVCIRSLSNNFNFYVLYIWPGMIDDHDQITPLPGLIIAVDQKYHSFSSNTFSNYLRRMARVGGVEVEETPQEVISNFLSEISLWSTLIPYIVNQYWDSYRKHCALVWSFNVSMREALPAQYSAQMLRLEGCVSHLHTYVQYILWHKLERKAPIRRRPCSQPQDFHFLNSRRRSDVNKNVL